jgi:glycine betaine/proline transport system substrate-binding protein
VTKRLETDKIKLGERARGQNGPIAKNRDPVRACLPVAIAGKRGKRLRYSREKDQMTSWKAVGCATAIAACLTLSLGGAKVDAAELGATDEPIKLALNEWTGQHITTRVAGEILQRAGYQVEYVTAGYFPQFTALADGTVTASLEIWSNNIGDNWIKARDSGKVIHIGNLGLDTNEGWTYPKHMEEVCPGLPDWQALIDCAEALATPETFPEGRILSYPADWGTRSADIIKGLEIPYQAVPAGSEGALVAELKGAAEKKSPLIMMFWAPHWVFAEVDVGWVELPTYAPECTEDASWGPNPNEVNDCGVDVATTFKVAWKGAEAKWPAAHAFLSTFQFKAEDQIPMMAAVDVRGEDLETVTKAWVEENESVWRPWLDAAVQ